MQAALTAGPYGAAPVQVVPLDSGTVIPKDEIRILDIQVVGDTRVLRILVGTEPTRVIYMHIQICDVTKFILDALDQGADALPPITTGRWNNMYVFPQVNGHGLQWDRIEERFPEIQYVTSHHHFDFLEVGERISQLRPNVAEIVRGGRSMIVKTMCFASQWENMNREMWATLHLDTQCGFMNPYVTPEFRAVITQNGRPIGFMMDKVYGRFPGPRQLRLCQEVLQKTHDAGLCHNNLKRHHFIFDAHAKKRVFLISFEKATRFDPRIAEEEMASLPDILREPVY